MNRMNQKTEKTIKRRILLIFVCVLTALAVVYIGFSIFFQSHFCFGTTIDGISAGGRSVEKMEELIQKEIGKYSITLEEREGKSETISGSSIAVEPVFEGEVKELLDGQNGFAWIAKLFQKEELDLKKAVTYDEAALEQALKELSSVQKENQREPVNASCSDYKKGTGYELVPADYGTVLKMDALKRAAGEAVNGLEAKLSLEEAGCYKEPEIGDDDEKLLSMIDKLNSYVNMTVTYEFGENKEVLDGETISTWLFDENREAVIDEDAVSDYVKALGKKYNTAYKPKTLETSYGTTVTISNGSYGWRISGDGEKEQLLADLEEGKSVEREPVYLQTAHSHGENDYGDSYVEINLTAQHLFLYKNGKLVIESDFVSGNVAKGHSTPTGAYGLTYKTTDAVLRGEDYETPVKYWMPFAGDVGMHDATWRKSFGGSIYKRNGSHGCINLPYSAAQTIYGEIEKGFPVLVYALPGTEGKAVMQQDASTVVAAINIIGTVTLESETVINNARNLYNALPDSAKSYVTNYGMLTAAEAALAQLKNGNQTQQPGNPPSGTDQPSDPGQQPSDPQPGSGQPSDPGQQPDNPPSGTDQPSDPGQQPSDSQPGSGQPSDSGASSGADQPSGSDSSSGADTSSGSGQSSDAPTGENGTAG